MCTQVNIIRILQLNASLLVCSGGFVISNLKYRMYNYQIANLIERNYLNL